MSDGFIIRRGGSGGVDAFKVLVDRSITNVTEDMLDGLTSIPNSAFYNCTSLASITIPNSVTSIEMIVFYGCNSLASVTVKATNPPTLGSDSFDYTSPNLVIYVPAESVDAYKAANNWSNYASKIQAIPSE